jgi:hypothetical protein
MAEPKEHPTRKTSITVDAKTSIAVDAAVIRPASTKHGPRQNWRELEFAQLAIQALRGSNPPKHQDYSKLTRDVNEWLQNDPDWRARGFGEISRPTVLRALKKVFP